MRRTSGFRLGSIAGIEVVVDWSLLIIFLLIAISLATGVFPTWHPDWSASLSLTTALAAAVLFFASVLAHELSHAIVGRANGITIRRITLFMFGGMAHMENEPRSWRAEFVMAIVGPLTSLLLGFAFIWLAQALAGPVEFDGDRILGTLAGLGPAATLLLWLGPVNIILALFNLVPGFPLDGGRVLRAVMWGMTGNLLLATRWASRAGQAFAWLLMAVGFLMVIGYRVPIFGTGFVSGIWLAFIGWFLNNAALVSYRQLLVREALDDVPVRSLMQTRFTSIDPATTVAVLVEDHLMPSGQRGFPVVSDGRFAGLVTLADIRKVQQSEWPRVPVSQVMTPVSRTVTANADLNAAEALELIGRHDLDQIPVVENGEIKGLLRRKDILKWLSLHAQPVDAAGHRA